jgi:hypothetical protein
MKTTYLSIVGSAAIMLSILNAKAQQSEAFIHVSDAMSINTNMTRIDHELLNENPFTIPVFVHRYSVGNNSISYMNKKQGIYYAVPYKKWAIFNQDQSNFTLNSAYNVLAPGPDMNTFVHVTANDNIIAQSTVLDHTSINNNPNAVFIVSDLYGSYHLPVIGVFYDNGTQRWRIYNTAGDAMPTNKKFHIAVAINGQAQYGALKHISTAQNITNNRTALDNPNLNGNPDAVIFVTQVWNGGGAQNAKHVGVFYANDKWQIYNQNINDPMPDNAGFNVIYFLKPYEKDTVDNNPNSLTELANLNKNMNIFPNPATTSDQLNLTLDAEISGTVEISMYNLAGQCVYKEKIDKKVENLTHTFDLKNYTRGMYLLKVESNGKRGVQKLIIQ